MTQLNFEAPPLLNRRAPITVYFARAAGLLIIAAAAFSAIAAVWGIVEPNYIHINDVNLVAADLATAGLALGLIALAAIAPNIFSRSVFLVILTLIFIHSPYAQSIAQEVLRDRSSDKLDCRALR